MNLTNTVLSLGALQTWQQGEELFRTEGFSICKGEKVAIKGDSGSGKSTLLQLLMGFFTTYEGVARVFDAPLDPQHIHAIRSRMAWVPQEFNFHMDRMQELFDLPFTFRANRHLAPEKATSRQMLEQLGLSPNILDRSPEEVSGGEKQRVFLAACLLLNKELVLLDEPTSALDAESKQKVMKAFLEERPEQTLLVVAHDPEWEERADRVLRIGNGQLNEA